MDLRGGRSIWQVLSPPAIARRPLHEDLRCDCLVVGSGITGALIAFHLADAGVETVVIDRRPLAAGSTPVSTALLQYDIDVPLVELRRRLGRRHADAAYRHSRQALDQMAALVKKLSLDCGLAPRPSLYLAHDRTALPDLKLEYAARREISLEVEYLDQKSLRKQFGVKRTGGILSALSLELDPLKLTHQLLLAAELRGARLFSKTTLKTWPSLRGGAPGCTAAGNRIHAGHVVIATGYETPDEFPSLGAVCQISSTYALATTPLAPERLWPRRGLIWETGQPYLYARTTPDHRVIIGGGDDRFKNAKARDARIASKTRLLLKQFDSVYSLGPIEVQTAWAGTFAQTADGLPYIGVSAAYPRRYFALGYGGNGITFSLIAAKMIRDAILGRANSAAGLFAFDRPRLGM